MPIEKMPKIVKERTWGTGKSHQAMTDPHGAEERLRWQSDTLRTEVTVYAEDLSDVLRTLQQERERADTIEGHENDRMDDLVLRVLRESRGPDEPPQYTESGKQGDWICAEVRDLKACADAAERERDEALKQLRGGGAVCDECQSPIVDRCRCLESEAERDARVLRRLEEWAQTFTPPPSPAKPTKQFILDRIAEVRQEEA